MDSKYLPINYRDQEKTLLEKVIHIAYIPGPLELASQVKELEYDEISQEFKKLVSTDMIYSCTNLELANILVKSFQNNKITTS